MGMQEGLEGLDRKYRALQIGYAALTADERERMSNEVMEALLFSEAEQQFFDELLGASDDTSAEKEAAQALSDAIAPAIQASRKDMLAQVRNLASAIRRNAGKLKESAQQTVSPALHRAAVWYRKNLDRAKARYIQGFPYEQALDEQIAWVEVQQAASTDAEQSRRLDNMHRYLMHEQGRQQVSYTNGDMYAWLDDDYDEEVEFLYENKPQTLSARLELLEEKLYDLPVSSLDAQIAYVAKCIYEADTLRQDGAFDEQTHGALLNKIERGGLDCFTLLETARQDELHEGISALEKSVEQGPPNASAQGKGMAWIKEKTSEKAQFLASRVEPRAEDKKTLKALEQTLTQQKTALMRGEVVASKPKDMDAGGFEPPKMQ